MKLKIVRLVHASNAAPARAAAVAGLALLAAGGALGPRAHAQHAEHTQDAQHAEHAQDAQHAEHMQDAQNAQHAGDPPVPPVSDADREAAFPDLDGMDAREMMPESPFNHFVLLDQLEARDARDGESLAWDLDAWLGRDLSRLWVRSEGERHGGDTEHAELQLLWGRPVAPWWDFVAGARRELAPGDERTWAAAGIQGLAPYRFAIEATLFVAEGGRSAARVEAEYELLLSNRWILQPLLELNWHGRADRRRGIGTGLSSADAGLRLRYEIRREIAPYIGLVHEKRFGSTADLARRAGEDADDTRLVAGVRFWF